MNTTWAAALAATLLAGCATPYESSGGFGGFSEVQLDTHVFKVSFDGNKYTSPERATELALLRSADVALQHGFSHFVVVETRSREDHLAFVAPTETTTKTTRRGNGDKVIRSTTTGGDTLVSTFPSTVNTIQCFAKKPPNNGHLVYDARFLCHSLGKKHGATCKALQGASAG